MKNGKKVLLVLGGISVLEGIVSSAKKNGYYVIVTDYLTDSPAKKLADESWMLSIDDVKGIVQKCKEAQVDGVMNYCIDPGQKPYQQICEQLGVPCVASFQQFDIMTNKDKFVAACRANGVDTIPEYDISSSAVMKFPVMIKPADSRASKGLIVCNSKKDLKSACDYALSYSKRKVIRAEKYMIGKPEICAKYFVVDGEVLFTSMADVFTCYLEDGRRVYLGTQTYPSRYYKEYLDTTHKKVVDMIHNIGIENGATSFTGFYDDGVFRFFDPSLRMGGAQDWMIGDAASGVDISSCLTHFAMNGVMGDIRRIKTIDKAFANRYSALLYFDIVPGVIGKIEGVEAAKKVKGVYGYHQCHYDGDVIKALGTTDNVAMRFVISYATRNEFVEKVREIQSLIKIEDVDGNNMLAPLFDPEMICE